MMMMMMTHTHTHTHNHFLSLQNENNTTNLATSDEYCRRLLGATEPRCIHHISGRILLLSTASVHVTMDESHTGVFNFYASPLPLPVMTANFLQRFTTFPILLPFICRPRRHHHHRRRCTSP